MDAFLVSVEAIETEHLESWLLNSGLYFIQNKYVKAFKAEEIKEYLQEKQI